MIRIRDCDNSQVTSACVVSCVEFLRTKKVAIGVELSYDDSKIKVKAGAAGARPGTSDQEVTPCGFMVGVYAVF